MRFSSLTINGFRPSGNSNAATVSGNQTCRRNTHELVGPALYLPHVQGKCSGNPTTPTVVGHRRRGGGGCRVAVRRCCRYRRRGYEDARQQVAEHLGNNLFAGQFTIAHAFAERITIWRAFAWQITIWRGRRARHSAGACIAQVASRPRYGQWVSRHRGQAIRLSSCPYGALVVAATRHVDGHRPRPGADGQSS